MTEQTEEPIETIIMHSININPYGLSWPSWVVLWWKWCFSKADVSPASDSSWEPFTGLQRHKEVWFLGGTFGGKANRKCEIPRRRSIFFPIVNDLISFATDPQLKNESELSAYAKADLDETRIPPTHLNIDGFEIPDIKKYRVQSPVFDIVLPPIKPNSNEFGSCFSSQLPVTTRAVSDGYWAFLKPLQRGEHRIEFIGEKLEYDTKVKNGVEEQMTIPKFRVDVTYQIYVD
jgi:hypothetical protein